MNENIRNTTPTRIRTGIYDEITAQREYDIARHGGDGKYPRWSNRNASVSWIELLTETGDFLDADDGNYAVNLTAAGGLRAVLLNIATYAIAAIEEMDAG